MAGVVAACIAAQIGNPTLGAPAVAADIDYSDFDDALMRDMDDAIKELDSNVGGQDEAAVLLANAAVLEDGLGLGGELLVEEAGDDSARASRAKGRSASRRRSGDHRARLRRGRRHVRGSVVRRTARPTHEACRATQ